MTTSRCTVSSSISSRRVPPACWMRARDVLEIEARLRVQQAARIAAVRPLERLCHVAHDGILNVLDDPRPRAVLEVMGVDVDDQHVVEPPFLLLALRVGQHVGGRCGAVEFLYVEFPDAVRSLDHRPSLPVNPCRL